MIDYHVHTPLCNHAEGVMEAYVRRAVAMGLREICFLDHLTIQRSVHQSGQGLSMAPDEVAFYFQAIQFLKQRYKGSIDVKAGLEMDFNPAYIDLLTDIAETYAFDVVASSLHFLDDLNIVSSGSAWKDGKKDTDDVYGLYFEQLDKMMDYDYFDMVCHLDLVKKFGRRSSRSFDKELNEILTKIKKKNLTVEINTSGFNHPVTELYPSPDIIKKCHQQGISITLGSDAHKPEDVGQHYGAAVSLLLSAGYTHLTTFTRRSRGMVSLINP